MAIYAIGDIQGCYDDLLRLLDKIQFDSNDDKLWFVGDLVNRGSKSLETLRFVKSLGDNAVTVLGNHDLHLLAVAYLDKPPKKKDTLQAILKAKDRDELLDWLRCRPLFHHENGFCLLHAGIPPQWDFDKTLQMASYAEQFLQGDNYMDFFENMYGDSPAIWSEELKDLELMRFVINCFTRMRYCNKQGELDFHEKGAIGTQAKGLQPWFNISNRKSLEMKIIFGHWSTLGYHQENNCYCIDTGALWGGELTALKLSKNPKKISIKCKGERKPNKN